MISDLLTDKRIQIAKTATSWQEAIALAAAPLLADGSIASRYIDEMIKSVEKNGPYIVLMKHCALAHARPKDGVNQLALSALTLKTPVCFGSKENDPVKVIFCLAAKESESHLQLMSELASVFSDDLLAALAKAKSPTEFRNIILKG